MSLRLDMIKAARQAPKLLGDAADPLREFLRAQLHDDGGAKDRTGKSDLYYTVFALDSLSAMQAELNLETTSAYLHQFGDGADVDLVHRSCLARCWAAMPAGALDTDTANRILNHIEAHRSADGGYNEETGCTDGTVYHCYMALGAYEDLGSVLPNPEGLLQCIDGLRLADGGYANELAVDIGITPVTAAAIVMMRHFGRPVPKETTDWMLAQCMNNGGFLAAPGAPFPDLLSTATSLHALTLSNVDLGYLKEKCLDFVDGLWTGDAFRGHFADDEVDSEYAFYALLALGHLSTLP